MPASRLDRFMRRVVRDGNTDCWLWGAGRTTRGYGTFHWALGDMRTAYRAGYELFVGPVPEGLTLDHLCRNRLCVNPAHLEPVTMLENVLRGESPPARNARKTHCNQGHPLSGPNLSIRCDGRRICRTCMRARSQRYRARLRGAA